MVVLVTLLITFNLSGLYNQRRGVSRVDQFYRVSAAVSVGLVLSLALNSILLGNRFIYSRQMLLSGWILCIALVTTGRFVHGEIVGALRKREATRDRLLIVGAGKTGRLVLETIARSPGSATRSSASCATARTARPRSGRRRSTASRSSATTPNSPSWPANTTSMR